MLCVGVEHTEVSFYKDIYTFYTHLPFFPIVIRLKLGKSRVLGFSIVQKLLPIFPY